MGAIVYDSRNATENLFGEAIEILLVNLNEVDPAHPGNDRETNFDNVRLSSSPVAHNVAKVATPFGSPILLGLGVLILGSRAHKML